MQGTRKFKATIINGGYLLIALLICAITNVPVELFWAFAAGLTGQQGFFTWGNSKEHEKGKP